MATGDLDRDHARREVLHLAGELTRDPLVDAPFRVLVGARLLDGRAADEERRRRGDRATADHAVRPGHDELRLAQIAIALGDAFAAYSWTSGLAYLDDAAGLEARHLMRRHADLIAAGAPIPDGPDGDADDHGDDEDDDEDWR